MIITTNSNALRALNSQLAVTRSVESAASHLSTGSRINAAGDDAAGLSISSRLTAQIKGLGNAARNIIDAISMVQTADAASADISTLLQRMRELALKSSTDTLNTDDRAMVENEFHAHLLGVEGVLSKTTWNGQTLLDGSSRNLSVQIGANSTDVLQVDLGNLQNLGPPIHVQAVPGTASLDVSDADIAALTRIDIGGVTVSSSALLAATDDTTLASALNSDTYFSQSYTATVTALANGNDAVTITEKSGFETDTPIIITFGTNQADFIARAGKVLKQAWEVGIRDLTSVTVGDVTVSSTELLNANTYQDFIAALNNDSGFNAIYQASTLSVDGSNANNGFLTTTLIIEKDGHYTSDPISFGTTRGSGGGFGTSQTILAGSNGVQATAGVGGLSALTTSSANVISRLDGALELLNGQRASYGAVINRLYHAGDSLNTSTRHLQSSRSHIQDTDYAKVATEMLRAQIIRQAGVAMLAQANQEAHEVMTLLDP